jgi:hypothetical protein
VLYVREEVPGDPEHVPDLLPATAGGQAILYQLDIFGTAHELRPRVRRPSWQPSLIPPECERTADAEEVANILEAFRAAGNRGPDEPPEGD